MIALEAIREVIDKADAAKIPNEEASEALNDAVDIVPANAEPMDRRRVSATAALGNFIKSIGKYIWRNKGKLGGGALKAAKWVQEHSTRLAEIFNDVPIIKDIIDWIKSPPL